MPVGTWFGQTGGGGGRDREGNYAGSLTGPGPASQPRASSRLADQANTWGPSISPGYQGGQGSTSSLGQLNPNIGSWALGAAKTASNQLAQQAVGPSPSTSLSGARSILDTFYGPQNQLLGDTLARQRDQLGLIPVEADRQRGILTRDTALAREGLSLDRSDIGLDKKALGIDANLTKGQLANLDHLRAILGKQFGLEGEALKNQLSQLGIDEAKLRDMAKRQTFDLRSTLTARGAFNTVANERGTGRINRDLVYGLGGINNQRNAADIQHRGNILGLTEKGIGYDNQGLALGARLSNIGVDSARLDNALARVGLDEQALGNQLQDGLDNIGIGEFMDVNKMLDLIGGTNVQQAEMARTILEQTLAYANLPPDVLAALSEALGIRVGNPNGANSGVAGGTTR